MLPVVLLLQSILESKYLLPAKKEESISNNDMPALFYILLLAATDIIGMTMVMVSNGFTLGCQFCIKLRVYVNLPATSIIISKMQPMKNKRR